MYLAGSIDTPPQPLSDPRDAAADSADNAVSGRYPSHIDSPHPPPPSSSAPSPPRHTTDSPPPHRPSWSPRFVSGPFPAHCSPPPHNLKLPLPPPPHTTNKLNHQSPANSRNAMKINVQPDLPTVVETIARARVEDVKTAPNIVPLVASFPAEFLNPSGAYLKLAAK